ncbi:MAG: pyridoxal 5'-phosphate synthase glutaminase subunit PdxT [Actinomycetota bacterium]
MVAGLVGVLALQGDFAEHLQVLKSLGKTGIEVRSAAELEAVDYLIIPGGESTTMLKLVERVELRDPLKKRIEAGMPVFGTCAGAILMAEDVSDGEIPLGVLPVRIERNAYGRQVDSFETDLEVPILGATVKAVFIRAPAIESIGEGVETLARCAGRPVLVRRENVLAATFHPELAGEQRIHRWFLEAMVPGVA